MSLSKALNEVSISDLNELRENEILEGRTLDYKEQLPGKTDEEKKEFLADVTSFANASGGHLIYGVKEGNGIPIEVCGVEIDDPDALKLRLENLLRDCVEPRVAGVEIHPVKLENEKWCVILRIPRSFARPHDAAKGKKYRLFYSRNSGGKYSLDVPELKAAFVFSEALTDRLRNFRTDRIGQIVANETPVKLDNAPKIVLHLVPLNSFEFNIDINFPNLKTDPSLLRELRTWGHNSRFNFDGLLIHPIPVRLEDRPSNLADSYVQIYRKGIIEAVELYSPDGEMNQINGLTLDRSIYEGLKALLYAQQTLDIEPPILIMISLLEFSGFWIGNGSPWSGRFGHLTPIDRNQLIIPEIMIENYETDLLKAIRPILDSIWNASNWPGSQTYAGS